MRVAVPVWNGRVSPVFDTAGRIIIANIDGETVGASEEQVIGEMSPQGRVRTLSDLGVQVLICGGISRPLAALAAAAGIRLSPWVAGETDEVLRAYVEGRLSARQFMMPGRCGRRKRFRGGRMRPWWR